jgi:hypothetical protein
MSSRLPSASARRRSALLGVGVVAAGVLSTFLAGGAAAAARSAQAPQRHEATSAASISRRDPARSVPPSQAFFNACFHVSSSATSQRACDRAALHDFDKVRATEGLARMSLPRSFPKLSAPHQLLVLVNIERADRGLAVFPGLSKRLDSLAAKGARAGTDPPFPAPFPGDFGGANWAGTGTSTLLADYVWMYDDGAGSPNGDCRSASDSGCWGHRHNIIHHYDGPRRMGAAVAQHGGSMAEEYIGADHTDHVLAPGWTTLAKTFTVGVSPSHSTIKAAVGGSARVRLTVWASGKAMRARVKLSSGRSIWSLSRSSCRLKAGTSCTLTVTVRPTTKATHHATITVTGPHGSRVVRLTERAAG